MRWTIRTSMLLVALLAIAFASPDPLMAAILIFGCPLWVPVLLARTRPAVIPSTTACSTRPTLIGFGLDARPESRDDELNQRP